ncbi:hypothetical protein KIL84_013294 [Mauremys mutica]|uniref:Uncharacterized protein n=1 Tax=Mauremys mutica TaxID=74926 RepID=A0A9D4AS93_9SAUR|nr:hypothetical protein KIL84_013294 [Mauremys mutica]
MANPKTPGRGKGQSSVGTCLRPVIVTQGAMHPSGVETNAQCPGLVQGGVIKHPHPRGKLTFPAWGSVQFETRLTIFSLSREEEIPRNFCCGTRDRRCFQEEICSSGLVSC